MKKNLCLLLCAACTFLLVSCTHYHVKHLEIREIQGVKTALVIDTDFSSLHHSPPNPFNLKCEKLQDEESARVINWLNQAGIKHRKKLMAYLAEITGVMLSRKKLPSLNIDKNIYFDSKEFPMRYSGDRYTYSSVCRDFSSLNKRGYTHILFAGFPNRIFYSKGKNIHVLYFGIDTYLYDIRPGSGNMTSRGNRIQRQMWCYHIAPSTQTKTDTQTHYGMQLHISQTHETKTTYTYTTYYRNCLGIVMVRQNGKAYTMEEIFTGTNPLYIRVYKGAALINLGFSANHLAGRPVPSKSVKMVFPVDLFLSKLKIP